MRGDIVEKIKYMTLNELSLTLPNGFHDTRVHSIMVDYNNREVRLRVDVWIGDVVGGSVEAKDNYRGAVLYIMGLVFWVVEPPDARYPYLSSVLVMDTGAVENLDRQPLIKLPTVTANVFVNWIYIREWNSFIYCAASDARLEWTE